MAGWGGSSEPPSLVAFDIFVKLAGRALRRGDRTGAAVAMVAVGLAEMAGANGGPRRVARAEVARAAAGLILEEPGPATAAALTASSELMILCGDVADSAHADAVVRRIHRLAGQPVEAAGMPVLVAAATGVAMASRPGETAETLIDAAGRAMRAAWQPGQAKPAGPWPRPAGHDDSGLPRPRPGAMASVTAAG
jgi:Diguanylate cyclase, GGDEF domain